MKHRLLLLTLCLASAPLFAQSGSAATAPSSANIASAPGYTAASLVGKWEHRYDTAESRLYQVTELKENKTFTQHAVYKDPQGNVLVDNMATGTWSFDGVNFIRVVTAVNQQKLPRRQQVKLAHKMGAVTASSFQSVDTETQRQLLFTRMR